MCHMELFDNLLLTTYSNGPLQTLCVECGSPKRQAASSGDERSSLEGRGCPLRSLRSWSVHSPQMAAKVVPRRSSRHHDRKASPGMSIRVLDCQIYTFKHRCTK